MIDYRKRPWMAVVPWPACVLPAVAAAPEEWKAPVLGIQVGAALVQTWWAAGYFVQRRIERDRVARPPAERP